MGGDAMTLMAGATTLGDLAVSIGIRSQQSAIVAELKAGSEDAYAWLIAEFHQPIYSLVYRIVDRSGGRGRHHAGSFPEGVSRHEAFSRRVQPENLDLPYRGA